MKGKDTDEELIVPELEELLKKGETSPTPWSDLEVAVIRKYYHRVTAKEITKAINRRFHGGNAVRTVDSVCAKAKAMGITSTKVRGFADRN